MGNIVMSLAWFLSPKKPKYASKYAAGKQWKVQCHSVLHTGNSAIILMFINTILFLKVGIS